MIKSVFSFTKVVLTISISTWVYGERIDPKLNLKFHEIKCFIKFDNGTKTFIL